MGYLGNLLFIIKGIGKFIERTRFTTSHLRSECVLNALLSAVYYYQ